MVTHLVVGAWDDLDLFMVTHLVVGAWGDLDLFMVTHLFVGAWDDLDLFMVTHLVVGTWGDSDLFKVTHLDVGACDDFDSFCTVPLPGLFLLKDDITGLVLAAYAPCAIVGAAFWTLAHSSKGGFSKVFKQCLDFVWGCHFFKYSSTCCKQVYIN